MAERFYNDDFRERAKAKPWALIAMGGFLSVKWLRATGVRLALVSVTCAWLAWQIIANTMADSRAESDPLTALRWRHTSSAALVALAEEELSGEDASGELEAIKRFAVAALRANPLDERAIRALGFAADLRGDVTAAQEIMKTAGKRTRRDAPVQIWLFNQSLASGRLDDALAHADALLRTRPDLKANVDTVLLSFVDDADGRDALTRVLASNPPWRQWFLGELSRQRVDAPATVFDVYAALKNSAFPPTNAELQVFLNHLITAEQYELAYLTWLDFLPLPAGQQLSYAYNGNFDQPLSGLPFDWSVSKIRGATTEVVTIPPDEDRVLRIEFANTRVPYSHTSKLLLLPPGQYTLGGRAKADRLVNDRGMVWRLSCAGANKQLLGETIPLSGTSGWAPFEVRFQVPQTGCRAQWLRLQLAARTALEQQVGGAVFYDDLKIERDAKLE